MLVFIEKDMGGFQVKCKNINTVFFISDKEASF